MKKIHILMSPFALSKFALSLKVESYDRVLGHCKAFNMSAEIIRDEFPLGDQVINLRLRAR